MELASETLALWGTGAVILLLLAVSALFSGSETALTTASRGKLHARAERGDRAAARALRLTEDRERLIGAVLLGNNFANIMSASLATYLFTVLFGENGVAVATLVMTAVVLVFAEVMPKTYAITSPETFSLQVSGIISLIVLILTPLVNTVRWLVRMILRLFGIQTDPTANILAAQEEIAGTITLHHSEGAVEKEQRDRLLGALDLGSRDVEEVMMHRRDIEMIDADAPRAKSCRSPSTRPIPGSRCSAASPRTLSA